MIRLATVGSHLDYSLLNTFSLIKTTFLSFYLKDSRRNYKYMHDLYLYKNRERSIIFKKKYNFIPPKKFLKYIKYIKKMKRIRSYSLGRLEYLKQNHDYFYTIHKFRN
jgi:hypothetical protein